MPPRIGGRPSPSRMINDPGSSRRSLDPSPPPVIRNLAKNWIANPSRFDPLARFGPRSGGTTYLTPPSLVPLTIIQLVKLMVLCVVANGLMGNPHRHSRINFVTHCIVHK